MLKILGCFEAMHCSVVRRMYIEKFLWVLEYILSCESGLSVSKSARLSIVARCIRLCGCKRSA